MLARIDGRDLPSTLLSPPVLGVGPVLCGLLAGDHLSWKGRRQHDVAPGTGVAGGVSVEW